MPNAKDLSLKDVSLNILAYGESGQGKTVFAGTFPKPYFFDLDDGMLSLQGRDVEYDTFQNVERNGVVVESAFKAFMKQLRSLEKSCPFETVVIDSITMLQYYTMQEIMASEHRDHMEIQDWGALHNYTKDVLMRLKNLKGCHKIVVAHEQGNTDSDGRVTSVGPLLYGKMAGQIPLYFDEIYRVRVRRMGEDVNYRIETRAGPINVAKSRLGCLPPIMECSYEAIMAEITKRVEGGGGKVESK